MTQNKELSTIKEQLFSLSEKEYADFHSKLIPGIDRSKIIGVRTPELRTLAKKLYGTKEAEEFLKILPHKYYEENNLHAYLLQQITDINLLLCELDRFLPCVDNWATCDMMRPKALGKHKKELLESIEKWLSSDHTYTIRYGIEMLMLHFSDRDFLPEYPEKVASIISCEYYVNMMRAWYFAELLAVQYNEILPYFQKHILDRWTHNKALQKAIESRKIQNTQKEYLKTLKIKEKSGI